MFRQSASYIDNVFKGVKPGDLAVGSPQRFELVINAGTARALGLDIPQHLRDRADRLIE